MKSYREITMDLEEFLGRRLTADEEDYAYIMQLTGSWGFSTGAEKHIGTAPGMATFHGGGRCERDRTAARSTPAGDYRYLAKAGDPIQWQYIREAEANSIMGVFLVPERPDKAGRICCAQFVGRINKRIWISIQQAEAIVLDTVRGLSFAAAVDKNL